MPIEIKQDDGEGLLNITLAGTIDKNDYRALVAEFTRLVGLQGKLRLLLGMTHFHGWDTDAHWEEMKFDIKHLDKIDCLAVVGEVRAQRVIACYFRPFIPAEVRYFEVDDVDEARAWLTDRTVQLGAKAA